MTTDPFTTTAPQILPSILSADFSRLDREIEDVVRHGADFLHLDVMDGHFVPNISFGPHYVESIRKCTPTFFDAHLMIDEPLRYAEAFVKAGAQNITFHVEAPGVKDVAGVARQVKELGVRCGITLRPATPVETIWPAIEIVDVVLIMSVVPGFSGQRFMPEVLNKAREVKKRLRADQRMEIDGGIHAGTIRQARDAGVDWFVAASAIFDKPDRAAAIRALRSALGE